MFLSQKFHQCTIPILSHITGYSVYGNMVAYTSHDVGLVVRNATNGKIIFFKPLLNINTFNHVHMNDKYLVYLQNKKIYFHQRVDENICHDSDVLSVPFSASFCQHYAPWISDVSIDKNYVAYCINFHNKVQYKVFDMLSKKEVFFSTLTKYSYNDFQFDYMERPLVKICQQKMLCSIGGSNAYLYEDIFTTNKCISFHLENDIFKIFMDESSLGFVTDDDDTIQFHHYDLSNSQFLSHEIPLTSMSHTFYPQLIRSIQKYKNHFFFSETFYEKTEENEVKDIHNSIIHKIELTETFPTEEVFSVSCNVDSIAFTENNSMTTIGRNNISNFVMMQKRDVLLPLFKGCIEKTFGGVHENIDMKRQIFEFLS